MCHNSLFSYEQFGNTPIHFACKNGHVDIVSYLLSKGVLIDIKNDNGNTPVDEIDPERNDILDLFTGYSLQGAYI